MEGRLRRNIGWKGRNFGGMWWCGVVEYAMTRLVEERWYHAFGVLFVTGWWTRQSVRVRSGFDPLN